MIFGYIIQAQDHLINNDTVELSINGYKAGNIQWQFSYDNKNFTNILGADSSTLKFKMNDSGIFRAKVLSGNCSYFTTEQFIFAQAVNSNNIILNDEKSNIKISWNLNLNSALVKNYLLNFKDTVINIDAKTSYFAMPRKLDYYGKEFSIKAVTYNDLESPAIQTKYENNFSKIFTGNNKFVAHRGLSGSYPENSALAFKKAAEAGFKFVECDIVITKDGEWVLSHDGTIDRTSNGTGKISEMNLSDLLKYDFGYPKIFGSKYPQKIITLKDFVKLCKELNLIPFIELKQVGNTRDYSNLINIVTNELGYDSFTIFSFFLKAVQDIRLLNKDVVLGLSSGTEVDINILTNLYPCFYCMYFNLVQPEISTNSKMNSFVSKIFESGIFITVWTVNDSKYFDNLINNNFHILTDILPDKLKSD
jgi:glycerophosphoryl diester phosphodiesterase